MAVPPANTEPRGAVPPATGRVLDCAGRELNLIDGQISVFFVMVVAAAEVVVGLAIIVTVFRRRATASVDELASLKG